MQSAHGRLACPMRCVCRLVNAAWQHRSAISLVMLQRSTVLCRFFSRRRDFDGEVALYSNPVTQRLLPKLIESHTAPMQLGKLGHKLTSPWCDY